MKYKVKKGLIFEKKGKKIVIFDSEKSEIYELNEIGSLILKEIKNKKSTEKILDFLIKNYKVKKTKVINDIVLFINMLKKMEIINEEKNN